MKDNKNQHSYTNQFRIMVVREILSGKTYREIYNEHGVNKDTCTRWKDKYSDVASIQSGYIPNGHDLKGTSTLYDNQGNIKLQWIKTNSEKENQQDVIEQTISALRADIPVLNSIPPPNSYMEDYLTVIPIADAHIGLYCFKDETGDDFDMDIAKRDLCKAFDYLLDKSPNSEQCLIMNCGDFFHWDGMEPVTNRSGHILDAAGRSQEMISVAITVMRYCIENAAKKHKIVQVVNSPGNHDDMLSYALSCMLYNLYENNERIVIHNQPTTRHYIRHGKVLIGVTHGHQTKDNQLPVIMATEKPKEWGDTKFRYFYRGHHHHDNRVEFNGCIVEQFRTLSARDSYAVSHGYFSGRDLKSIVHHKEYGEVSRLICSIDMIS